MPRPFDCSGNQYHPDPELKTLAPFEYGAGGEARTTADLEVGATQ